MKITPEKKVFLVDKLKKIIHLKNFFWIFSSFQHKYEILY